MWEALLKIQKVLQSIRPLKVEYEPKRGYYENTSWSQKITSYLVVSNVSLIWLASGIGLKILSSDSPNDEFISVKDKHNNIQKKILNTVLHTLYLGIYSLLLAAVWTNSYRSTNTVWMMTQAKFLYAKRESHPSTKTSNKKLPFDLFDMLLYSVVVICIFGIATLTFPPIITDNTPAHLIFKTILPKSIISAHSKWLTGLCCAYLGVVGGFGVVPVLQTFTFMCAVIFESQFVLRPSYQTPKQYYTAIFRMHKRVNFQEGKLLFSQNQLFVRSYNDFGDVYFPLVMTCGFCVNVVTSLVCIKFYEDLSIMLLLIFGGFDLVTVFVTIAIHSFCMAGLEEFGKFEKFWRLRLFTKLQRRQFRACMPLKIGIGCFFNLKRRTLLNTISEVVKQTTTLLIADE
ncbi:unnamed protein product [Orchesella dallaii]|uniref:Odorant receptor n=1 Tax=Orchesella dallaii TaxID=48710 RepID=A0ABP1Q677_9HEXA